VTSPAHLPAAAAVIGVDGCRAGWVGVHWSVDDTAAVLVAGTMLELVGGLVAAHGPVDVVGVDIPLHLPTDAPRAAEREATGLGLSRQAFGLFPAIRDARAWLAGRPEVRVEEVHPESSFAELAGEPLLERKKTADGAARRRALLVEVGLTLPLVAPRGAGLDDLLDAGAAAWSARRVAQGTAVRLPEDPADGAPIWV